MKSKIKFLSILLILALFLSCNKQDDATDVQSLAEQHDFNEQLLTEVVDAARADGGIKCLIINRNGVSVVEEYFVDDHPDSTYHVRSVTKSVTSLLFGLAIDRGILSLDETIGDYLSDDYAVSAEVAPITIEDLLTMSAGFEWDEMTDHSQLNAWASTVNPVQTALDLTLIDTPGEVFTYNTAGSQILSAIFLKATGQSLFDFAKTNLFAPLDMSERITWDTDVAGVIYGGAVLRITPIDMLKIGLLYLNDGMYNGSQFVSKAWIDALHYPHLQTYNPYFGKQYGYKWWIDTYNGQHYYFANGYGGQFIFVFPAYELVVVARSDSYLADPNRSRNEQWWNTISLVVNKVFAALN